MPPPRGNFQFDEVLCTTSFTFPPRIQVIPLPTHYPPDGTLQVNAGHFGSESKLLEGASLSSWAARVGLLGLRTRVTARPLGSLGPGVQMSSR